MVAGMASASAAWGCRYVYASSMSPSLIIARLSIALAHHIQRERFAWFIWQTISNLYWEDVGQIHDTPD